jgi:hypothetical protein
MSAAEHPVTPDGRYFVVRDRLWRRSNPGLEPEERDRLVKQLMAARRAVREALHREDAAALAGARRAVDAAKVGLGERGPVWWTDGAPDENRRMARDTGYAEWFASLEGGRRGKPCMGNSLSRPQAAPVLRHCFPRPHQSGPAIRKGWEASVEIRSDGPKPLMAALADRA